jgi:hypothetical protein
LATLHRIGTHRLTVDGDWAELVCDGPLVLSDSTEMHALLARMLADNAARGFLLADIDRLAGLGPDVRRQMSAWNAEHRLTAAAVHGGSFAMRTILTLALKAIKFRDSNQLDVLFARDEPEARRWLTDHHTKRGPR